MGSEKRRFSIRPTRRGWYGGSTVPQLDENNINRPLATVANRLRRCEKRIISIVYQSSVPVRKVITAESIHTQKKRFR